MDSNQVKPRRELRKAFVIFALLVFCATTMTAQEKEVILSRQDIVIMDAVKEIETQTGYVIGFKGRDLDISKLVALPAAQGSTEEILGYLLEGTGLTWMLNGEYIIVIPAPQELPVVEKTEESAPQSSPVSDKTEEPKPQKVRGVASHAKTYSIGFTPEPESVHVPRVNYVTAFRFFETPHWALKSNLLADATLSVSLAAEVRLGHKATFELPVSFNFWEFSDNRKWKHLLVQPEFRWWLCEAFNGHFFGLHAHYGRYNVGNLPSPPFSETMRDYRFDGWLAGTGLSYGYHWIVGKRWSIEAEIGVGYAYLDYTKYPCVECGREIGKYTKNYFGPTKAAVNLVFMIK